MDIYTKAAIQVLMTAAIEVGALQNMACIA